MKGTAPLKWDILFPFVIKAVKDGKHFVIELLNVVFCCVFFMPFLKLNVFVLTLVNYFKSCILYLFIICSISNFFMSYFNIYVLDVVFLEIFFRAKSKEEQIDTFFKQGDFGYIQERQEELMPLCASNKEVYKTLFFFFLIYVNLHISPLPSREWK